MSQSQQGNRAYPRHFSTGAPTPNQAMHVVKRGAAPSITETHYSSPLSCSTRLGRKIPAFPALRKMQSPLHPFLKKTYWRLDTRQVVSRVPSPPICKDHTYRRPQAFETSLPWLRVEGKGSNDPDSKKRGGSPTVAFDLCADSLPS